MGNVMKDFLSSLGFDNNSSSIGSIVDYINRDTILMELAFEKSLPENKREEIVKKYEEYKTFVLTPVSSYTDKDKYDEKLKFLKYINYSRLIPIDSDSIIKFDNELCEKLLCLSLLSSSNTDEIQKTLDAYIPLRDKLIHKEEIVK